MKHLDAWPFSTSVRIDPHAALAQIREAVRPAILRHEFRKRRKARIRRLKHLSGQALIVTLGVLGTFAAAAFVANETYHFVSWVAERLR